MRRRYEHQNFSPTTLKIIEQANNICRAYGAQGLDLTLRQLFYQFVSRNLLPNTQQAYKRLGTIIGNARMAGLLDWNFVVDRTRNLRGLRHWDSPEALIKEMSTLFRIDKWKDQPSNVECWIEKDALIGVLEHACTPLDVPFFSCRGYTSISEVWEAAQRIRRKMVDGHRVIIVHLGDHDPSGLDMTRDIANRLVNFLRVDLQIDEGMTKHEAESFIREAFDLRRIALNMPQVQRFNCPPNPAKFTDSRAKKYVARHGRSSWELDALPPDALIDMITQTIVGLRDEALWNEAVALERKHRAELLSIHDSYAEVVQFVNDHAAS